MRLIFLRASITLILELIHILFPDKICQSKWESQERGRKGNHKGGVLFKIDNKGQQNCGMS